MFSHSSFHLKQPHKLFTFKSRLIFIVIFMNLIPKLGFMPNTCYRIVWNMKKFVFFILWNEVFCLFTFCDQNMHISHILLTKLVHEYSKCLVWYHEITKGRDFVIGLRFVILDAMYTWVWLVIANCKVPLKWPFEMCSGDVLRKTWTYVQNFVLKVLVSFAILTIN